MAKSFRAFRRRIDDFRYRRAIHASLALNLRGEVRTDGLTLSGMLTHLEIEWLARDIHPWDRARESSCEERAYLFVHQCLGDTEAAIGRLFDRLPQIDRIELKVLDPESKMPVISGTVYRTGLERNENLSVGMRLMLSGLTFRLSCGRFDTLDIAHEQIEGHEVSHMWDAPAVGHL